MLRATTVPLAATRPPLTYAMKRGPRFPPRFGSVAQGTDGFESGIDLIGTPTVSCHCSNWLEYRLTYKRTHGISGVRGLTGTSLTEGGAAVSGACVFHAYDHARQRDIRPASTSITSYVTMSSPDASNGLLVSLPEPSTPIAPGYDSACMVSGWLVSWSVRNTRHGPLTSVTKRALPDDSEHRGAFGVPKHG